MKAYISFGATFYLVEFEPFMGKNIKKYQKEFEKWYYEEIVGVVNGKKKVLGYEPRKDLPYKYFDLEPIFDWMREMSPTSNPRVLEEHLFTDKFDKKIPGMYF